MFTATAFFISGFLELELSVSTFVFQKQLKKKFLSKQNLFHKYLLSTNVEGVVANKENKGSIL